jgi:hypothetical protein
MQSDFSITFEGDYIKVLSNGEKKYEVARELWSRIRDTCIEHNCFFVLGVAHTPRAFDMTEIYNTSKLFADLGISRQYCIAWVETNSEMYWNIRFLETFLHSRGLPGRLFPDVSTAEEWLLGMIRSGRAQQPAINV